MKKRDKEWDEEPVVGPWTQPEEPTAEQIVEENYRKTDKYIKHEGCDDGS